MRTRQITGLVLVILTIPALVLGLLDPLEGGIAMLVAGALILTTRLVSRVEVPRVEWIAWFASVVTGAAAIAGATWINVQRGYVIGGPGAQPWWVIALVIGYEVGVVVTLVGGVQYLVRQVRAVRHRENVLHA
jgi:hypothetical protein